jgi:ParB family chromosome partitioning protein
MTITKKKLAAAGGSFNALAQGGSQGMAAAAARGDALDATGRVRRSSVAPVSSIVFNPLNPRKTITDQTIQELGESLSRRQVVPLTVVSRDAFLDAHPEQARALGDADFVALDGNRRLLAAQRAGLQTLRVDLNDDLVATAADMVEAALVANAHREDVPPFEEAQTIEQLLLTVYEGNQAAVARRLGKSRAWVGQRLALLHLTPELQEQAGTGELPLEEARRIGAEARAGKLTSSEQKERAAAVKKSAQETKKATRQTDSARTAAAPGPAVDVNAVYTPPEPAAAGGESPPVDGTGGIHAPAVPVQRDAPAAGALGTVTVQVDLDDTRAAAQAIRAAMDVRQAAQLVLELLAILQTEPEYQEIAEVVRSERA